MVWRGLRVACSGSSRQDPLAECLVVGGDARVPPASADAVDALRARFEVRNPHHPGVPITTRMLLTHTSSLWSHPEIASGVQRSTASDLLRPGTAIGWGGELDGTRVRVVDGAGDRVGHYGGVEGLRASRWVLPGRTAAAELADGSVPAR